MMPIPDRPPAPLLHLYRLTIDFRGDKSDVYSMATSVETAFNRYLDRLSSRKESAVGVLLLHGELADPRAGLSR
jgi:hypothetical protein